MSIYCTSASREPPWRVLSGSKTRHVIHGKDVERLASLIAERVALPNRGGFFDPRGFLVDPEVRESYEDPDTLLVGGDASREPASQGVPRGSGINTAELLKLCK